MRRHVQETVKPLPVEGKAERVARGKRDELFFMKTYLPHYFTADFAPWHKKWLKKLRRRAKYLFLWIMGRDYGKTVFGGLGYPIHQGVYGLRNFFVYISKNQDLASDNLEFIRLELEENPRILQDFGPQKVAGAWEYGDFRIKGGMRFMALGLRSPHRGWRNRQYRPDLIFADDLDDDERVESEKLITKDTKRLISGAYFMLDKNGTMMIGGNKFSNRGILARIQEDHPNLDCTIIKALEKDRNGVEYSTWPELYPTEFLVKERGDIGWVTFNRERQNEPVEQSDYFQPAWFRGVTLPEINVRKCIQYLDPAIGTTDSADFRSHTVLGLDENTGNAVVMDCVSNRDSLTDMVDQSYALHERWNTVVSGMEETLMQKLLWRDYRDGAKRHGYVLPNRGIDNKVPKPVRIEGVSGPIQLGQIVFLGMKWEQDAVAPTFDNPHMKILYESLVYYPNFKKDPADSLAGAFKLLEEVSDTEVAYRSARKRRIAPKRRKR